MNADMAVLLDDADQDLSWYGNAVRLRIVGSGSGIADRRAHFTPKKRA